MKEETAKANPLLVNMKGADDKTWGRDQHLMQETWGVTEDPLSAECGKVLNVEKLQKPTIHNCHQKFQTCTCDQAETAHT